MGKSNEEKLRKARKEYKRFKRKFINAKKKNEELVRENEILKGIINKCIDVIYDD